MAIYPPTTVARFWSKVNVTPDDLSCWEWKGSRYKTNGSPTYGKLKIGGRTLAAHRVAWEIANNEPLNDRHACHHCDNMACVNPSHIYAGSRESNVRDSILRGRNAVKGERKRGHVVLSMDDVQEIRRRIESGETNVSIAKDYPVSDAMVSKIRRGVSWRF